MLLGLYTQNGNFINGPYPERVRALVAEAKYQGDEIISFNLDNVDLEKKTVSGYLRENGQWVWKTTPFPKVIITHYTKDDSRSPKEDEFLKKVPPIAFRIFDKYTIYREMKRRGTYADILIDSFPLKRSSDVNIHLQKYREVILKPIAGRKGADIFLISKKREYYEIHEHNEMKRVDQKTLDQFLTKIIHSDKYILQPYIRVRTSKNQPFDFRIHVQRDEKGRWQITKIYPRIGRRDSYLSNLSREGITTNLEYFLHMEFPGEEEKIHQELVRYGLELAEHVNSFYPEDFYFDELGIDLSRDREGRYWLFEINAGPETAFHEWERARNTLRYAKYARCRFEIAPLKEKLEELLSKLEKILESMDQKKELPLSETTQMLVVILEGYYNLEKQIGSCYSLTYSTKLQESSEKLKDTFNAVLSGLESGLNDDLTRLIKERLQPSFREWSREYREMLSYF
ncbi:MAG TPA: YheC/YheD family protein [Bacillota bacterium]|jgi:hypothetical protein|nr:hypothetical protein [Bacillota bacterium]HOB87117.1 YheC/YheD family protein [Bacillota bacterium]HOP69841.1 YheC/YheD family protein [Bacillota bacterium]HPT34734.1 YheC/YheD family protein [Bacillota bacterium]HPZ64947.1 YheC/YheD family protein [Bacillota bacterium]